VNAPLPASHAAYLAPPPRPPHDPFTLVLDGRTGWRPRGAQPPPGIGPLGEDGALTLIPLPGSGRTLQEDSGSFGGLVLPHHATLAALDRCQSALLLFDAPNRRLLRFDPCACAFVEAFCLRRHDPRLPAGQAALASHCGRLYIADRDGRRVLVLNAATGALRGQWRAPLDIPPCSPANRLLAWEPAALAIAPDGDVWVGDRMNGLLLRLAPNGCVRERHDGFGAIRALAANRCGQLLVASEGATQVVFYDPVMRRRLEPPLRPADVVASFAPLPLAVRADGSLDLSALCQPPCAAPCIFGPDGALLEHPLPDPHPVYPAAGTWLGAALDSGIAECVWDRIVIDAGVPEHTKLAIEVLTAETWLDPAQVQDNADWQRAALASGLAGEDFMLRAPPGRYLWLRLRMHSNGSATPALRRIAIDYPRISWRRYLPAVFGAEPVSAEFTDRWLGIFERAFLQIETALDSQAGLFDPRSAPATPGHDFLGFLAGWVGLQGTAMLPLARRRALLRSAPALYPWRGTLRALQGMLYLFFGLEQWRDYRADNTPCVPCPVAIPDRYRWRPPRLLLEHYVLRRWLWLGYARLSDNAKLWGERIVNRSRLGDSAAPAAAPGCPLPGTDGGSACVGAPQTGGHAGSSPGEIAQVGVTQLKTWQDPLRDPFHVHAHQLSVFVPAACLREPALARALGQLLKADIPAHVKANLVPVEARMRVGVQAMLGLDAVIGYRPAPVALDEAALGKGTVLGGAERDGGGASLRVGTRRLGMDTRLQ
jgi:phage tail-like protein